MPDIDQQIEDIERQLSELRLKVVSMKSHFKKAYCVKLEQELSALNQKLDSIKAQLEKSYAEDIEKFNLQRENYFLKQGMGREEMERFIENMERKTK